VGGKVEQNQAPKGRKAGAGHDVHGAFRFSATSHAELALHSSSAPNRAHRFLSAISLNLPVSWN
jgi:hypothetical protein